MLVCAHDRPTSSTSADDIQNTNCPLARSCCKKRPSDRSGNDSANGGDAADMRFLSSVEKVEARDEVVVLENERKKGRPPPPALTSRCLASESMHHVSHWCPKAPGPSSKRVCSGTTQSMRAATAQMRAEAASRCCGRLAWASTHLPHRLRGSSCSQDADELLLEVRDQEHDGTVGWVRPFLRHLAIFSNPENQLNGCAG